MGFPNTPHEYALDTQVGQNIDPVLELLDDHYDRLHTYKPSDLDNTSDRYLHQFASSAHMVLNYNQEARTSPRNALESYYFASSTATIVNSLVTIPEVEGTDSEVLDIEKLRRAIIETVNFYLGHNQALDLLICRRMSQFGVDPLLSQDEIRTAQPRIFAGLAFMQIEMANEKRFKQAQINTLEALYLE
jgi:hypothetical protein